jgi:TPR repeat protein
VVTTTAVIANEKSRGSKENERGLAFMQERKSIENLAQAKKYFLKSANLGYTPGQLNLAKLNLTSGHIEKALFWFKQAALQGNELAIEFYWDTCKKLTSCDVKRFTEDLTAQGFVVQQP